MSIVTFFKIHYCDVICRGFTGCKYPEGNVRRGEGF